MFPQCFHPEPRKPLHPAVEQVYARAERQSRTFLFAILFLLGLIVTVFAVRLYQFGRRQQAAIEQIEMAP